MHSSPHVLYRLYDYAGELLYIGITGDWERRRAEHAADKEWWRRVQQVALAEFPSRAEAMNAERIAIRTEHPTYNISSAMLDRSPRIDWHCDACDELIEKDKGAAYQASAVGRIWHVTHDRAACRVVPRREQQNRIPISRMHTVDRFLFATWLVIDLDLASRSNWNSIIARAQAFARY